MDLKRIFGMGAKRDLTQMNHINSSQQPTRDVTVMPESGNGQVYYYVGAIYEGQPVVLGRFYSWEQANTQGRAKLRVPFEIFPLQTGDMRKATKMVKYALLEKNNIDTVMHRAKHVIEPDEDDDVEPNEV